MSIAVAVSGGVDSAAAAWLLQRGGHRIYGVYMHHPYTAGDTDWDDARRLSDALGIDLHRIDVGPVFEEIVEYFADEYFRARTPNPCAVCNRRIKFGTLMDAALNFAPDANAYATGHYARLCPGPDGETAICRAVDTAKDQTYVLFGIERSRLDRLRFPLGTYTKAEVRDLVRRERLPISPKRESQDVCFIPRGTTADFLRSRRPNADTAGNFVSTDGRILAPHSGFERFTVGQRKGFGVGFGERVFVAEIDATSHNVVLGNRSDLACGELLAVNCRWCAPIPVATREPGTREPSGTCKPGETFRAAVQVRYRSPPRAAEVRLLDEQRVRVVFETPLEGVAPGQCVVFYDGDRLLGGGFIESTRK